MQIQSRASHHAIVLFFTQQGKPVRAHKKKQLPGLQPGTHPSLHSCAAQVPANAAQGEDNPL